MDAVEFPDTPWSMLARQAAGGDEDQTELRLLLQLYWQPVFCAIRDGWQVPGDEAGSLCDQFLTQLLTPGTEKDVPPQSRFRHHLMSELVKFMDSNPRATAQNLSSGIAIDTTVDTTISPQPSPGDPQNVFEQQWVLVVFREALEQTRVRLSDNPEAYATFLASDVEATNDESGIAATDHGLRLARTTFRRELIALVYQSVSSIDDAREELRWLLS